MPASKPSRSPSRAKSPGASSSSGAGRGGSRTTKKTKVTTTQRTRSTARGSSGDAGRAEQVLSRLAKQLDFVLLTRERIQQTLDEAAERGRVTRTDANMLVSELVQRGRQQRDDVLRDIEQVVGKGRGQIESATRRARKADSVDRIVRQADRARRTVGVGPSFPILGYDDLSARQVTDRLDALGRPELRKVRDYERRHANRKTVLAALDRALD